MERRWLCIAATAAAAFSAGCSEVLVKVRVDEAAFRRLPEPERLKVFDKEGAQLVRARLDQARAEGDLELARRAADNAAADRKAADEANQKARAALDKATLEGDQRTIDQAQLDKAVAEEGQRVVASKTAWLEAQRVWRERFAEAAIRRVTALGARLELAKAELLAARAPADQPFDLAPFQGQLGRLHQAYSSSLAPVATAHADVDRTAGELAAAKTRYAKARQVVLPKPYIASDEPPTLPPEPPAPTPTTPASTTAAATSKPKPAAKKPPAPVPPEPPLDGANFSPNPSFTPATPTPAPTSPPPPAPPAAP